jgi:Flp pilus assembly protein TadG
MILNCKTGGHKDNGRISRLNSGKGLASDERGSALIEMALALPIMMMMLTGIFSFSMVLYQKLQLAEALSAGGRVLAADRGDIDPCKTVTSAIYAAAPGLQSSNIGLTYTIGGVNYGSATTTCPGAGNTANASMTAGGTAQIQATYPCNLTVYGVKFSSCSLGTQIAENVQ